jgi:(3S)-malyl-CoA thioesterase
MARNDNFVLQLRHVRTALYVPASNARALDKAKALDSDMLILDLEDGVPEDAKADARQVAQAYVKERQAGKLLAIRLNAPDSPHFADDLTALSNAKADLFVLPKVENAVQISTAAEHLSKPVLAMIETPTGLYAARAIAAHPSVAGLIAGTNDIAAAIGIRPGPQRQGLELPLQMILMAGAEAGKPCFDGVCNRLDDMDGFEAECLQGYGYGFVGKTVIHPNQIAIANRCFAPDTTAVEEAEALLAAHSGGAQRFRGRMIEAMHVVEAQLTIERASHAIERLG